jgi:hypothetical protein
VSLDGVRLRAVSLDGQSLLGRDQANVLHSFPASSLTPRHGPNCSRPAQRPPAC